MGFIALGLFSMTDHGVNGALLQMLNHGVSTGALFILVGVIYERRHTRLFSEFGGLAKVMPWYALFFVIVALSSIGLPGTNGFVGEFMILVGTFTSNAEVGFGPWGRVFTLFAATGVIFAAVYMLHAVLKIFWGPITHKANEALADLSFREVAALLPLMGLIFWIGLYPATFLDRSEDAVNHFVQDFHAKYDASKLDDSLRLWGVPPAAADDPAPGDAPSVVADAAGGAR